MTSYKDMKQLHSPGTAAAAAAALYYSGICQLFRNLSNTVTQLNIYWGENAMFKYNAINTTQTNSRASQAAGRYVTLPCCNVKLHWLQVSELSRPTSRKRYIRTSDGGIQ